MKTTVDEQKKGHTGISCHAQAASFTISSDSVAGLDRLARSFSLSGSAMVELLIVSAERNAIEVAKTLPSGLACYNACELRFSASQQDSILSGLIHADTTVDALAVTFT